MSDFFSLPILDELCHELLAEAKKTEDTIKNLREENAKLKAERDAFVQLFSKAEVWKCQFCAHNRQPHRTAFADCDVAGECKNTGGLPTHFELRGVKEKEDAEE